MKALAYESAHRLHDFAIELMDVAEPELRATDLLVGIRAIGMNPGEAAIRQTRSAEAGGRLILGWEFAGVVEAVGPSVSGFAVGDRVMGTGDWTRDGAWAERVAVDYRVTAKIPDDLAFSDAASLPIAGLTAWEALFRDQNGLVSGIEHALIVGGAGGVGSMASQLLSSRTSVRVASTASRPESREWCLRMGADVVVDHRGDVPRQLRDLNIDQVDLVISTSATADSIGWIMELIRPFGHLVVIDVNDSLDFQSIAAKSVSVHTENVFSRVMAGSGLAVQGKILNELGAEVIAGRLSPITTTVLSGLRVNTMKAAHELAESRRTVGKTVISV